MLDVRMLVLWLGDASLVTEYMRNDKPGRGQNAGNEDK